MKSLRCVGGANLSLAARYPNDSRGFGYSSESGVATLRAENWGNALAKVKAKLTSEGFTNVKLKLLKGRNDHGKHKPVAN